MATSANLDPRRHDRAINLNLTFSDFGVLAGSLDALKQPFIQKAKNGMRLTEVEQSLLNVINSLSELIFEQAKISTSDLPLESLTKGLDTVSEINGYVSAIYSQVLGENIQELIKRIQN